MERVLAYLNEAVTSLWRNRARSILTMLGMIIGTSSIITVFGLSRAATSGISGTLDSFGTIPVTVNVDLTQNYPDRAQFDYTDAKRVAEALGTQAREVEPAWTRTMTVKYGARQGAYTVATTGSYEDSSLQMSDGRKLDATDLARAARNVALSQSVAEHFFPDGGAVGKQLDLGGTRYTIVGVYAPIKSPLLTSLLGTDYMVVPYSAFHRNSDAVPDSIQLYADKGASMDEISNVVKATLQRIHGADAQYQIVDGSAILKGFEDTLAIVGNGLAAIGAVALVVAGIGIMNIMLVTVAERTKEIGLRKSIGASRGDIMLQFLMESLVLAVLGGGVGMALGILATGGGAYILSRQLGDIVVPYLLVIAIALSFSIGVGMLFGLYPAFLASRLDPIEALRT